MYFYHRTDDRGNPLVSCPATPSTSRSLPLFVLLSLSFFTLSYQLIPPCVEQLRSLKLIENKFIFGCTKKREIYQRRVCVALKSGTKIELEKKKKNLTFPVGFCYTSGLEQGFCPSQSDTFVTVAFLTFVLDAEKNGTAASCTGNTHTQFVICLLRLDTNDLAYDVAKQCD